MDTSQNNRLRYLLNRCLSGKETLEERTELDNYLASGQPEELIGAELLESFYHEKKLTDMDSEKQEQILAAIHALDRADRPVRKIHYWRWAGVAALFLAVLIPFLIDRTTVSLLPVRDTDSVLKRETEHSVAQRPTLNSDIPPAQEEALLEMADGTRIALEKLPSGKAFQREGLTMERAADGGLILRLLPAPDNSRPLAHLVHTIKTPRGGTYKVVLSDGTIVHLNADSRLSFPTAFAPNERRVTFEGEAYFEVAKDKARQFIVSSGAGKKQQELRVYGTEFNLSAYPEENNVRTTLIEGSVKIKSVQDGAELFLKPNEEALLGNNGLIKEPADLGATLAWKNNLFYFKDEAIDQVMSQISRWYDIDVKYHGPVPQDRFWGQISRKKKLSEIVEILGKMSTLKFDIRGKEVYIME